MQSQWSDSISIRELGRDELDAVACLEKRELSGWSRQSVEEELDRHASITLAAVDGGQIVGWCCARFVEEEAELLKICVAEKYRRYRCGTELLKVLQHRLQEEGVERIYLEVRSKNEAAVSFYSQLGFTPAGRRISYYTRPSDDALVLRKFIS